MDSLHQNVLFSSLDTQQLAQVLPTAKSIQLKEGEILFRQQQQAEYFYLLETGNIKLFRLAPDGTEKVIELIREGQTFAEAVMFMQGNHYPVSAQALSECRLIRIEMQHFRELLAQSPETSLKILGRMSQRLHGLVQEIEEVSLQNAKIRVVQFLLRELPEDASFPYTFAWSVPKTVLASRLSIRPETFSRTLQQLSQEGIIKVNRKTIEILNSEDLQCY